MKSVKRMISMLLVLSMVFSMGAVKAEAASVAEGTCGENLTWTLDDEGTLTISGTGEMNGYGRNGMPWYEYLSEIFTVEIAEGVTTIEYSAFTDCDNLTIINIPETVTSIGDYAFEGCSSLTDIILPDTVTTIGSGAFDSCSSLTSINIPNGVTTISNSTFSGCYSLESISIPGTLTSIGKYAFRDCSNLSSITIPDGVTTIGDGAFESCNRLGRIGIPASVTSIGDYAFRGCSGVYDIWVSSGNAVYSSDESGVLFDKEKTTLICAPGALKEEYVIPSTVTSLREYAFYKCKKLTSITIPDGVTAISDWAFDSCDSLTGVEIPDGITTIGDMAFEFCNSLTDIIIPDSVTSIGYGAFAYCSSLASINIPDGMATIGEHAFTNCDSLTSVVFEGDAPVILSDAFLDDTLTACYPVGNETWTEDVMQDYGGTVTWVSYIPDTDEIASGICGDNLTWVLESDGILTISGTGAMTDFELEDDSMPWSTHGDQIVTVVIEEGVATIGDYAFSACSSLTRVLFKGDAPEFGDEVFCDRILTAYYLADNETWTEDVMQDYGGTITWVGLDELVWLEIISTPAGGIVDQDPDLSGLIVELVHWDGVRLPIEVSELTFGEIDTSMVGRTTVIVSYGDYEAEFTYGVHECKPAVILDPSTYPESQHNYADNTDETKTLTYPGATGLVLVFSEETCTESGWDYIYVYDGFDNLIARYSGYEAAGVTVEVPGDTVKIRLTSDDGFTEYGYSFTRISTTGSVLHTGTEAGTAVEPTCTTDGCTAGIICDICENHANYQIIPALGHFYDDERVCTTCGRAWYAEGICGGNTKWHLDNAGTLTISGEGEMDDCYAVDYGWSEYTDLIFTVQISNGVTSISKNAFEDCCNLASIDIPDSVTEIGDSAFYNCSNLTSIDIPDSVTNIDDTAFFSCSSLTSIDIPDSVTRIGGSVFYNCSNLTSIDIPDSVTDIGESAFYNCSNLTSIDIPDGVTTVGDSAFYGCSSLTNITIPEGVSSISDWTFGYCSGLTTINLPDSVTAIGGYAFHGCGSLTNITIPDGVTSIGFEAFYGCSNLNSIAIPDGVSAISDRTFGFCTSLASVKIPESVTTIGESAFYYCTSLTSVVFEGDAPEIGHDVFGEDTLTAYYPAGNETWTEDVMQNYGGTVTWVSSDGEIPEEPADPNVIASGTCDKNLTWVLTVDGVLTISGTGEMMCFGDFWEPYDEQIKTVVIENGVTNIGNSAFKDCSNLTDIIIPDSVTTIDGYAFYCCTSLVNITIPDGVTTIDYAAFNACSSLTRIDIPGSVTTIVDWAFAYCYGLTEVVFEGDAPEYAPYAFICDTFTAYYPAGNETWTEDVMLDYDGNVIWVPYYDVFEDGTSTEVKPGEEAVIHIDADHTTLIAVYMDGELVDPSNYTVTEGSTIITFTAEFMATLDEGDHQVSVEFQNGVANATITVVTSAHLPGDINGDGKVNNRDAARLMQYLAGWDVEYVEAALDVNGDGKINNRDAARLMQYLAGWDVVIN